MILKSQTLPKGWMHQSLSLHRLWHSRRVWQWKARAVAVCTLLVVLAVLLLGLNKIWLLAGLIGALIPLDPNKTRTLQEIEHSEGEIYTTALVAPEDLFGFSKRLLENAKHLVRNAELPALPWLEVVGIGLLASLAYVIPAQGVTAASNALAVNQSQLEQPLSNSQTDSEKAPPVLNAPAAGAAPQAGQDAANGVAASGGTPGESGVGDTKPGGGNATDDPEAVSRDYLDALERGAVKSGGGQPKAGGNAKKVEDLDSSKTDPNGKNQTGTGGQNGQNSKNGQGGNRGSQQPGGAGQNNPQSGQNGQGQQNNSGNSSNPNANGKGGKQNQNSGGKNSQKNGGTGSSGQDRFDRGDNGDGGSFPDQSPTSPQGRGQPGKAGRGGGLGSRTPGGNANGQKNGKLEYLPGDVQGNQVRSGAMQLPGDPKRPLSLTEGSPAYRRAVENAVLDPRLPPEYQELLKNYYK
jgi:hypothetical protein